MKRFKSVIGIFVILCLVMGLASCNRDKGPKIEVAATSTPTPDIGVKVTDVPVTPEPTQALPVKKTLIYATSDFSGKFSPFYAESSYDMDVVNLTQETLLKCDRSGAVLLNAMNGQKTEYNGAEYEYRSLGNCEIVENEDGTVDYNITMRDDVVFSDGVKATIDDVIFGLYVMADPSYDGISAVSSLPIIGMKEFRSSMEPLYKLLIQKGRENKDFTYWDEETQEAFWQDVDAAGHLFTADICSFCEENFGRLDGNNVEENAVEDNSEEDNSAVENQTAENQSEENTEAENHDEDNQNGESTAEDDISGAEQANNDNIDETQEEVISPEEEARRVRRAMFFWGYDDEWVEGMTIDDFWRIMCREYKDDIILLQENESIRGDVWSFMPDFETKYNVSIDLSDAIKSITGIKKTGDYSMTVTMSELDNSTIYNMPLYIVPMHYYGDEALYDYEASSFGFVKGDLSSIIEKNTCPVGCGAYVFEGYNNGYVTLKANDVYFKGKPNIDTIVMKAMDSSEYVNSIKDRSIDIAIVSSYKDIENIKSINANGEISGNLISSTAVRNNGYGYIGCNVDQVNVGKSPSSDKSKALRKAFMTLFAMYRDEAVNEYFGDLANVIEYPVSDVSWSAPAESDEGYSEAFNKSPEGEEIRRYGDSSEMLRENTIKAVIGYFKEAGFVWDETGKCFTAASENARLSYDIVIPGSGSRDHPAFIIADKAAEELAKIGITLNIKDVSVSTWQAVLDEGKADFWAGALHTSVDPDVYDVYHSDNLKGDTKGLNYFSVNNKALDELLIKGREGKTIEERKAVYREVYDLIMDLAIELPFYQRNDYVIVSMENINANTLPKEITPYYSWYSEINTLDINQ